MSEDLLHDDTTSAGPVDTSLTMPPPGRLEEPVYTRLRELVAGGGVLVLTGAGMSTASGIPDYRGPDGTRRVQPMQHGEFVGSLGARQRYWARAYAGWGRFAAAAPNAAHRAVADLEAAGLTAGIITQNVDGLHQRGGARSVLELHGSLGVVECLTCGERYARSQVQDWLRLANPGVAHRISAGAEVRPDGDVVVEEEVVSSFRVPRCLVCEGDRLKPDVVFFGGSVPKTRVNQAFALLEEARSVLVLGSSLRVMSGYRFVRRAARRQMPVAVVTRGSTRGDAETTVHVDALLGQVLPRLVRDVTG